MFFKKKIEVKLEEFISSIQSGNDAILDLIELSEKDFKEVPHSKLLENPDDIAAGVIKVKTKFNVRLFDIFDSILIKEHDNGDIKYIFYATTTNYKKVSGMADTLFKHLGAGRYDSDRHTSFQNQEKIKNLTNGNFESSLDDLVNVWVLEKVTLLLQYKTNPLNQFSFLATKRSKKIIDRSIRRNGTILNLLTTYPLSVLRQQEDEKVVDLKDGLINFIDYTYTLNHLELGVFDKLQIRQFGDSKDFSIKTSMNLTFTVSKEVLTRRMLEAVEKLIKVYGEDDGGTGEIEIHEIDMLENKTYWTGRNWNFNEKHGIWDLDNPDERYAYTVTIGYDSFDTGFTLTILSYNNLIDLFGEN